MALLTWVHNQRGTCIRDPIHVVLVTSVHDQVGTFDVLCISIKKKIGTIRGITVLEYSDIKSYLNVKFNKITSN